MRNAAASFFCSVFTSTPFATLFALGGLTAGLAGCSVREDLVRANAQSDMSCSEVEVSPLDGSSQYRAVGCGQMVKYTCVGEGRQTSCHPVPDDSPSPVVLNVPPAPAPLLEAPAGAGGFLFGATESDVRKTCEKAGHIYAADGHGNASCDGLAADVGAPARAKIAFCDGAACEVAIQVQPAADENIGEALAHWRGALTAKYGGPSTANFDIPPACRKDVIPCLRDGRSKVQVDWQWAEHKRISLTPKPEAGDRAGIEIGYVMWRATDKAPGL